MLSQAAKTESRSKAIQRAQEIIGLKPVFIDTETTGIDKDSEVVEIAIVDSEGKILLESLVKPSQPIPDQVAAIHGISNDMVAGKPTWLALWPTIRSFFFGRTVCAYNVEFDLRIMQQSHARYRYPWKESLNTFCVMKLYSQFRAEWNSERRSLRYFKLEEAGRHFGIAIPNSHRAADDTLLARAVLHAIAESKPA